ncbi:MAG: N-acetyltransferase [Deltaproteobacteria bacterium]|nr:N-acetyltransferase [Deltaproteobacteria bacterium]
MQPSLTIRLEGPADLSQIEGVVRRAFGRPDEAQLVNALRRSASPFLSLVALHGDHVVGHVALSPVAIEGPRAGPISAGLAPLSVLPETQRHGIGAALMKAALSECSSIGWEAVFLLGEPLYYARFGFEVAAPRGLHYESHAFDHAFQCREIRRGALVGVTGWVRYHEAFAGL